MRETKDLGTYFVRVEFEDGNGFFMKYNTGGRWLPSSHGPWMDGCTPLDSWWQPPVWESEDDMVDTIAFQFTEGNYSCDCNLSLFLARARGHEPDETTCGHTHRIKRIDLYGPDGKLRRQIMQEAI